jgi:hypothetical protein
LIDYLDSLVGPVFECDEEGKMNNWTSKTPVNGNPVARSVRDIVPKDTKIINPFNGLSVFILREEVCFVGHLFCRVIEHPPGPGTIYLGKAKDGDWWYYAFVFKGTDNSPYDDEFHAGMGLRTLQELRNGVFLGRFRS